MAEENTNQQPPQPPAPQQATNAASAQPLQQPTQQAQQSQQPYGQQAQQGQPYQSYAYGYAQPQPAYAASAQPKKSKAPWIALGIILFAVVACFTVGAMSCSSAVRGITSMVGAEASFVDEFADGPSVAVIDITGTIQYDGTSCSPEGLSALLDQAENDDDIKAVVLRVDSGGGTATAGEEMAEYVKRFSKPVVVSSASMNCSAAYEISSQADKIFVNKTTDIGAIGTVMQVTDLSELLDKLGIKVDNIASAESKDSSYGTRPLTDEERAYYQQLIDVTNETFIENVAEGRGMSTDEVSALATGLSFTGTQAIENGLADEIGIYDDALDAAAELGGIGDDYNVVSLTQSSTDLSSIMDLLGSDTNGSATNAAVAKLIELLKNEGVLS